MSEPLDLGPIKKRRASSTYYCAMADVPLSEAESDRVDLLAEVTRLRSELATLQVLADSAQAGYLWAEVERLRGELDRLRDEITDRANVEADLRAQLAEAQRERS